MIAPKMFVSSIASLYQAVSQLLQGLFGANFNQPQPIAALFGFFPEQSFSSKIGVENAGLNLQIELRGKDTFMSPMILLPP